MGARHRLWWPTLLIAAIFCFITFYAKGGLNLESMTTTEMALTLGAGLVVAAAVILAPSGARAYGLWPVGLLLAFTVLTALSIVWSVQPDHSWQDSGRLLAYSGVFGAGVALVRIAPERWPAVLGGLTLAAVVVCGYALLTKVFPGSLAPSNTFARLNEPYGYWNAIGLTAAMGAICCLWLGARRTGHALLRALAYPAMGVVLLTLVLAYSRGALAALAVGLVLWFCLVPLRLRGAALLIVGALGAGAVAAWDFSRHALSSEGVALAATHHRRAPARRAGGRDAPAADARGDRHRIPDGPAGALARAAPPGRDGAAGADRARGHRVRRGARPQPPGADGKRLACVRHPDQPERETSAEHAGPSDGGRERAGALLEGGPAGLRSPSRARRGRRRV